MSRKMSNRMQTEVTYLFRESTIPGFSLIFSIKSKLRRAFWITVLIIFIALTANSLYEIIVEFLSFPIIVNVLVGDSRVLPFPAITICNLNPVHRGRFCSLQEDEIEKPSDVDQILCANLDKMLDLCEISGFLNEILEEGHNICIPKRRTAIRPLIRPTRRSITLNTTKSSRSGRIKRQLSIRDFVKGLRLFFSGDVIGLINSTGLLIGAGESGSFLDTAVVQFAKIYGIRINSSTDLIPALFLKGFADLTGCKFGSVYRSNGSIALENTLKNITDLILNSGCVWKLPKLFTLFQNSSKRLLNGLSSCTAPWVRSVLGLNSTSGTENQSESPWYILLDLLQSWLADLGRHHIEIARKLGHQSKDMIKGCYFGGKKCDYTEFESLFSSSYGNCFSYNLAATSDQMDEPEKLSGFTGPKFGLELTLNLEVDQYMPTSRETGAKIVIHDQFQKADPDQDAIHIPPGVVTYVGIQMINITRLPAPYRDKCSDEWTDDYDRKWAEASDHESYTSQFCLKLCLQKYTLNKCKCWTMAAPPPTESSEVQCDVRQNRDQADCVERVREQYYAGELACDCPPRCNEKMYEKFISTGTEAAQCSALSSGGEDSPNDHKENTAKVIIYYQTLSFTEIRQDVKYTWSSIIGAIGGILGVYLGFSFIAIYEVFEIILRAALHIFRPSNSKIKIYDN